MTVTEVREAKVHKEYHVVSVWEHKTTNTHGAAKIAVNARGYSLLIRYTGEREGSDLVFLTKGGDKLTHIGYELEQLSQAFGKKFVITPTLNRSSSSPPH